MQPTFADAMTAGAPAVSAASLLSFNCSESRGCRIEYVPAERLILSTDCGFGRQGFNRHLAFYKASAIPQARNIVLQELGVEPRYIAAQDDGLAWDQLPDDEPFTHLKPIR